MAPEETRIVLGYPDFWRVIYPKQTQFFAVAMATEPLINETFSVAVAEPLHKMCRQLAKMVANSFSALLLLGMNGFGNDAMKIVRNMFETSLTISYLRKHPQELDDFMDFHWITAMRKHKYMEKYAPELLTKIRPEVIERLKTEYTRVAPRFMNKHGKVRGHWCRRPLSQIAIEVDASHQYDLLYPLASGMQHGDVSGVMSQIDPEPNVLDVDIAPSEQWVEQSLVSGHMSLVISMAEYIGLALPEKQHIATRLETDFHSVWSKAKTETALA